MPEKMNVLFIITDAQRADYLSCYGNKNIKTPNIDRLSKESVRFTNSFCTNPICMPNRATMITGVYPNVHGVRSNGINLSEDFPNIIKTLRNRGWHTAAIGKLHHQFWMAPFKRKTISAENLASWADPKSRKDPVRNNFPIPYYGYEEIELVVGNGSICSGHYLQWLEKESPSVAEEVKNRCLNYDYLFSLNCDDIPEKYYNTTYVRERTLAFLERFANGDYANKPFYLHCSFPDPHYPVIPPKKYRDMYKPDDIELPLSFYDKKKLYKHEFLGYHLKNPPFKKAFLRESTEEEARKLIALTYASISYVDYSIGEILRKLENLGYSDNTIVVFTSDHGDLMGDHGLLFKGPCPFNGVLHVPLIWKVPGLTKSAVTESLVSSIDYPMTILNFLNIPKRSHPPDMQGYDITPILEDPQLNLRDCVFIENDEEIGTFNARLRHLITKDYKLTIYDNLNNFGDIYDRNNDPLELDNLWNKSEFRDRRFELVNKLLHENLNAQTYYPKRIAGT
ncbi:MAG: sulfatase [Candidatus Heimdallarchaeota archaeon]